MPVQFGTWFTEDKLGWKKEFEKLTYTDFQRLDIEEDKLYDILEQLYKWGVIR